MRPLRHLETLNNQFVMKRVDQIIEHLNVSCERVYHLLHCETSGNKVRGPKYTRLEDLAIVKSWIAATEDPVVGANQSRKVFWHTAYAYYVCILARTELEEQSDMQQQPWLSDMSNCAFEIFKPRNFAAICSRWREIILPRSNKYLSMKYTKTRESGASNIDHINSIDSSYEKFFLVKVRQLW